MTDYVVESGFTRSDITLSSGDTLTVANGGTATNTIVLGSATIMVVSGGSVSGTNVSSGGVLTVDGDVSGTSVSAGGDVEVAVDGFTDQTVIYAGGVQRVAGFASGTLVASGGTQTLLNGGRAFLSDIRFGGKEIVSSGGQTGRSTVDSGGRQTVSFGGIVDDSQVLMDGVLVVSSGGTASLTHVQSGGTQILAGGTASETLVDSGGQETVASGGTSSDTLLSGGSAEEFVQSGGTASHTTAISGGFIDVFGGLCVFAEIGDGGLADVTGTMISTTVGSGGNFIMIGGTDSATLINGGSETVEPGALCIDPTIEDGSLDLTSGSLLSGGVTFAGSNPIALATMSFDGDPATIGSNTISGFTQSGDVIVLTGLTFAGGTSVAFNSSTNVLTVTEGAASATIQLDSETYTGITWSASQDSNAGTDITPVPCFCRGTLILTEGGEVAVEELAIGDRVVTVSGEAKPIKWIGSRSYDGRFTAGNRDVLPIRVEAGAIAEGVPARQLWVSPEHALHIDGALAPARQLVNGATITQAASVERLEYFHIELEAHDIIFAEGAPAESFVDCDNRGMFQNTGEFAALYPGDGRPAWSFCAPRLEAGSPELTAIRATLLQRAETLGHVLELNPDLHLIVDGEIVRPHSVVGGVHRFDIPTGNAAIWLASRSAVPAETEATSRDIRRLGVSVERIALYDADFLIEAWHSNAALCEGFHEDETLHRWTDGLARLPEAWLRCFPGAFSLEMHLAPNGLVYRVDPPASARAAA